MTVSGVLIKQLFDSLAGSWHVERIIDGSAEVSGTASFNPHQRDNQLLYIEHSLVRLSGGKQLSARQSYIYKFYDGSISVFFDEEPQRFFHRINFELDVAGSLQGRGWHKCNEDMYQINYRFLQESSLQHFQIEYTIDGPSKHSVILCRYAPWKRRGKECG